MTPVTRAAATAGDAVIDVSGLRMRYGPFEAVRGVDLRVRRGEVFAFLGPNGAGKTTTVEILEGYRRRTAGEVTVLGEDPARAGPAWRGRIGVVLQESQPERDLTVAECLRLYAGYYPAPRPVGETLELVGLTEQAESVATRLSGGQRRRLDVALSLIGDPELLFLDEPTTGFDPSARRAAWEMIAGLRALGVTVFLTTHFMDEAEYLADRVTVISDGLVVAEGTPGTIGGRERAAAEIRFTLPPRTALADLPAVVRAALAEAGPADGQGGRLLLRADHPLAVLGPLIGWAEERGHDLPDLEVRRPSLEDVYLALTGPSVPAAPEKPAAPRKPAAPEEPAASARAAVAEREEAS
ncbi:ABC transporter ATP-binding protein [Streptacidiphilus rugosus]|uniref:ABC transporter ATP-binding protein n=1 Tax=Streptacidiphilus rugosus TaxID=405783 RepID=UPI0006902C96|nr:ABC transporter ATP-binding protein [Streptacidiphilus rugosus]